MSVEQVALRAIVTIAARMGNTTLHTLAPSATIMRIPSLGYAWRWKSQC